MDANVPEKLYLFEGEPILADRSKKLLGADVEYTRTDAFIEKTLKWYCLDCICNDTCSNTCYFKSTFKKYLEGDDKQLPPKIENAINPDGSTTENYRYRHFISRMQDAFIEKACDYLMEYEFNDSPTIADRRKRVENFRNYMKGE